MKTQLLLILCLITTTAWANESIPNGGFENWDSRTYEYPANYPFNSNTDILFDGGASFNVLKTTTAQHGTYAVRLVTNESSQENGFGYFLNGNPNGDNPEDWKGGIPINEKPTGITGYYKYNVQAGDTAMVLVSFRKGGQNIGTYFLPLYGIHNTYTAFDFTFTPALTQTPDSMILGFTSSWVMSEISLPGSELYIDNISLKGVTTQPSKLNGDFETWSSNTIDLPVNWLSLNGDISACKKTDDKQSGNFALELHTYLGENDGKPQARPAMVVNGTYNEQTNNFEGGVPYNMSNGVLSFYYKYAPVVPKDSAYVWLSIRRGGQNIWYQNTFLRASDSYKQVKLPIYLDYMTTEFVGEGVQDSIVIGIQSNLWSDTLTSHVGAVLKIDGLELLEGGGGETVPTEVPNGSYELWDVRSYEYPEFYPINSNSNFLQDAKSPISVFKTTDKYSGSFAAKLTSYETSDWQNFGFFLNTSPQKENPADWTGGIPISEKPTGITGYYKYNMASGDSAMIIASFSKQGVNIGAYILKLHGLHSTYTAFDFNFEPALTQTPDSMILGFASSLVMNRQGVPGSELFIDNVALKGVTSQPAKMNGGFENWLSNSIESPQKWYIEDSDHTDVFKKVTTAQDGNYAIELRTYSGESDGNPEIRPGRISTGYYTNKSHGIQGGSAFTNMVDTLSFYYKYTPGFAGDSAEVSTQLKMNGEHFWYNNINLGAAENFTYAELPIRVDHFFFRPDTIIISIQSSRWSEAGIPAVGSVLTIDNLKFKSFDSPSSIVVVSQEIKTRLYPNPTYGPFSISMTGKTMEGIEVFNLSGQKVLSLDKNQILSDMEIDMSNYPRGMYLVKVYDGTKSYVEKLILK